MIGIKINDEYLDLDPDTQISFKLSNPIFSDDGKIPGSYSLPFNLPGGERSDKNSRILKHPDVVENNIALFSYAGTALEFDGLDFQSGRFDVQKIDKAIQANFIFGLNTISDDFASKSIRDLVRETIQLYGPGLIYSKEVVAQFGSSASDPYQLTVNGTGYSSSTLSGLASAINAANDLYASFENSGSTYGVSGDRIVLGPTASGIAGFGNIEVNFDEQNPPSDWLLVSDPFTSINDDINAFFADLTSATPSIDYIKVPWMRNGNEEVQDFIMNKYIDPDYAFVAPGTKQYKTPPIMPMVTLKHIFDKIAEEFGIVIKGTFMDDPYLNKALIVHNHPIWKDSPYINGYDYRFFDNQFDLYDLVPDLKVSDFLKAIASKYNLAVYPSNNAKTLTLNYRKAIIENADYNNWNALVSPPQEVSFTAATGVRLETAKDEEDVTDYDDAYETGVPSLTISSKLGSVKEDFGWGPSLQEFAPNVSSPWDDKFTFRLVFYEGLQDSIDASFQYAKASYKGMEVTYAGSGALAETQWATWLHFLQHQKEVVFIANLEYRHLNALDWERKVRINDIDYFIKDIDVTVTMRGIQPAKVTMLAI